MPFRQCRRGDGFLRSRVTPANLCTDEMQSEVMDVLMTSLMRVDRGNGLEDRGGEYYGLLDTSFRHREGRQE